MSALFQSQGWFEHGEIQQPEIVYPIEQDTTAKLIRRTYQGPLETYSEIPLLTPDGGILLLQDEQFADAYFVQQGEVRFVDGSLIQYTRTFATVPATRIEPATYAYNFIGLNAGLLPGERRPRFTESVDAEVEFSYYLTGVTPGIATLADIPSVQRQRYVITANGYDTDVLTATTTPTRAQYEGWIDAGNVQIVTDDSTRRFWIGKIVERQVIRVLAQ
jgi:hypothetical protein